MLESSQPQRRARVPLPVRFVLAGIGVGLSVYWLVRFEALTDDSQMRMAVYGLVSMVILAVTQILAIEQQRKR